MQGLTVLAGLLAIAMWPRLAPPLGGSGTRVRYETERTVLEVDEGGLSEDEARAFARLLDRGVADIESLVDSGLPSWARRTGPVRFIVSDRVEISSTHGRTVRLPLRRVRTHSAPYLHETVHALVPSRSDAVWLSEGLASYLESWVSENRGGYDAHVFTRAGDQGIHSAARRYLATDLGRAVLPWVGIRGQPPLLEEDRGQVARPFYVLSQSLTTHLVDSLGLRAVVRVLTAGDDGVFVQVTGRSKEQWRADWLRTIGVSAPTS